MTRWQGLGRAVVVGVAAGLLMLSTGDGRAAVTVIQGVDPLEVLNLRVKPNVVVLLDTSASMAMPPDKNDVVVGGDDPASRFYQAKQALRTVVTESADDVNMGLAEFGNPDSEKTTSNYAYGGPFVYVSTDAGAASLLSEFIGNNDADKTVSQSPGNAAANVYTSLDSTNNGFSTAYSLNGTTRYYIKSGVFRHEFQFDYNTTTNTVSNLTNTTCGNAPAGLLGDDTSSTNPAEARACFKVRVNGAAANTVTYWFTSAVIGLASGSTFSCNALDPAATDTVDVPGCTVYNGTDLNNALRLELGINDSNSGSRVQGLPEKLKADDNPPNVLDASWDTISGLRLSPPATTATAPGSADRTPTTTALSQIRDYYTGTVFPTRSAAIQNCDQLAFDAQCLQRHYILYVTDGQEQSRSCESSNDAAENMARALYLNGGADRDDRIETIVVSFTGNPALPDSQAMNDLARAGSGGVPDTANPGHWTCSAAAGAASSCRDAFYAADKTELEYALTSAMDVVEISGTYSDQQSITETVYELVRNAFCSGATDCPNPDDPDTRYDSTLPLVFQSTFDMPGFVGHLKAFRRNVSTNGIVSAWGNPSNTSENDAGQRLLDRVTGGTTGSNGMTSCSNAYVTNPSTGAVSSATGGLCTYANLVGTSSYVSAELLDEAKLTSVGAKIMRRIFTSGASAPQNGVFTYGGTMSVTSGSNATNATQLPYVLWPNPAVNGGTGITELDAALGISSMSLTELQAQFGACADLVTVSGTQLPANCASSAAAATRLAQAQQEARQIILAFMAGAEVSRNTDATQRRTNTGALLFEARNWVLAESTLAAPGVVTPPLEASPSEHSNEYALYRDGLQDASGNTQSAYFYQGYGLRNPDLDATGRNKAGTDTRTSVKPMMSVVYHAANDGLHAFRAGPACPNQDLSLPCAPVSKTTKSYSEKGGEELWMFVPFDQLNKLPLRLNAQSRSTHVYVLAAPVRFGDVFVKSYSGDQNVTDNGATVATEGKWRTVLYLPRGIAGKYLSALDVTYSGTYRTASLDTPVPGMVFNRGNPDTLDGTSGGTKINGASDFNDYATMGQTWSVPIVGRPRKENYVTSSRTNRCPTDEDPCIPEFALWMGSGFGSTASEGSSFYMLDAQTGDVLRRHDVGGKAALTGAGIQNAIVASPAGYNGDQLGVGTDLGHPASTVIERVYVGDVHGRLWKFLTDSTAPVIFADAGDDQPISVAAGLIGLDSDGSGKVKPHVYAVTGYDCRIPGVGASCPNQNLTPPFKMLGFRDDDDAADPDATDGIGGLGKLLFGRAFPNTPAPGYRGNSQPATTFAEGSNDAVQNGGQALARVFLAGSQFQAAGADCIGHFESIVYALTGVLGLPAYDLPDDGGAALKLSDQRVMGLRTVGGQLVVDRGIDADSAPPPPAPPKVEDPSGDKPNDVYNTRIRYGTQVCH